MNEEDRKTILRMIPYGLHVVTLRRGDEYAGFTSTWFTQCSFSPPLVMMAVKADSRAREVCGEGTAMTVHFLKPGQQDMAKTFFQAPEPENGKIGPFAFRDGDHGAPILEGCLAHLECRFHAILESGDHHLVQAEVLEAVVHEEGRPLALSDTPWSYGG